MTLTTTCEVARAKDIEDMVDSSKEITYEEFVSYIDKSDLEPFCFPTLHVKDDWHIKWFKSTYKRKPCVFMVHSRIEYVWE